MVRNGAGLRPKRLLINQYGALVAGILIVGDIKKVRNYRLSTARPNEGLVGARGAGTASPRMERKHLSWLRSQRQTTMGQSKMRVV